MTNDYVVYKHTNKINGKIYIGITNDVKRRWRNNGIEYKPKIKNTRPFWSAIEKYGWNEFRHEVILKDLTSEDACSKEKELIAKLHSQDRNVGYNIAPGGNGGLIYQVHPRGMLGKHQTEFQIRNQKEFMSHYENQPMHKVTWGIDYPHPKGMLGKHQTEHQKAIAHQHGENALHGRKIIVKIPGRKDKIYPTMQYASECMGVGYGWIFNRRKSGKPYKFTKQVTTNVDLYKSLDGCVVEDYLGEDTEVTI